VIKRRAGSVEFDGAPGPFADRRRAAADLEAESSKEAPLYLAVIVACAVMIAASILAAGCHGAHQMTAAERGAVIYRTNCSACHNENPNLPGSLGPAIAGSPKELIAARVLHGAYPVGYDPKRHTHIMKPLPWLGPHINDLTAYLAAAKAEQG
jgi:mono/diheme cytochrome c family protein